MGVRTNEGVHTSKICVKSREFHVKFVRNSCEFRTNSREFTPMNRLQAWHVLAPIVLGGVWAWWMLLGRDVHWMICNEAGGRILLRQIPQTEPKISHFPPKPRNLGRFTGMFMAHSKGHLSPVHEGYTVVDMSRAVTELRSMGDAAPRPEHCPLCHFCHGNSILSTGSNAVLATVHVLPGVGIILRNVHFGGFAVWSPPNRQFSATRGRVLWCTLVSLQMPLRLLDYRMGGTTAGSPHRKNTPQGFPRRQHQRRGTGPRLAAMTATRRMQCTGLVPVSKCTTHSTPRLRTTRVSSFRLRSVCCDSRLPQASRQPRVPRL